MRDLPYYISALLLGLSAGLLEVRLEDLLVTALFVMISTMVLGYLRPKSPWRWTLIVGLCVSHRACQPRSTVGIRAGIPDRHCGRVLRDVHAQGDSRIVSSRGRTSALRFPAGLLKSAA